MENKDNFEIPEEYEKYFSHHHEHGLTLEGDTEPVPRYSHVHSPEHKKVVLNRLSKAIGHLESVKRMVEEDRDCTDILMQLTAVRNALTNLGKVILKEHLQHCIVHAVQEGDTDAVEDINKAVDLFIK